MYVIYVLIYLLFLFFGWVISHAVVVWRFAIHKMDFLGNVWMSVSKYPWIEIWEQWYSELLAESPISRKHFCCYIIEVRWLLKCFKLLQHFNRNEYGECACIIYWLIQVDIGSLADMIDMNDRSHAVLLTIPWVTLQ